MAEFERGQTFLDRKATNFQGTKSKYFIAMNNADYDDDLVVCFVMNTEHRMDKYKLKCNRGKDRFILEPNELSFITTHTSVMLKIPCRYTLKELIDVEWLDIAPDILQREIKNCIDFNYLRDEESKLIKDSFK